MYNRYILISSHLHGGQYFERLAAEAEFDAIAEAKTKCSHPGFYCIGEITNNSELWDMPYDGDSNLHIIYQFTIGGKVDKKGAYLYRVDYSNNSVTVPIPGRDKEITRYYKTAESADKGAQGILNTITWIEYFRSRNNGLFPTKYAAQLYKLPGEKIEYVDSNWTDSLYALIKKGDK